MSKLKRGAELNMNHENADDDMPQVDAGQAQMASEEKLKRRLIIKGVRRRTAGKTNGQSDSAAGSVLFGFGGFGGSVSSSSKPFDFKFDTTSSTNSHNAPASSTAATSSVSTTAAVQPKTKTPMEEITEKYVGKLRKLNVDFRRFFLKEMEQSLESCFIESMKDYIRYAEKLQAEYSKSVAEFDGDDDSAPSKAASSESVEKKAASSLENQPGKTSSEQKSSTAVFGGGFKFGSTTAGGFNFGTTKTEAESEPKQPAVAVSGDSAVSTSTPSVSFGPVGKTADDSQPKTTAFSGFKFGSSENSSSSSKPPSGFTFGALTSQGTSETAGQTGSSSGFKFGSLASTSSATAPTSGSSVEANSSSSAPFKFGSSSSSTTTTSTTTNTTTDTKTTPVFGQASSGFKFGAFSASSTSPGGGSLPSFGVLKAATTSVTIGGSSSETTSARPFSFQLGGSSTGGQPVQPFSGFNFSKNSTTNGSQSADTDATEDNDQPPVVEEQEHVEKDAVFSGRAKLYYMEDGAWKERGVGTVSLVKSEDDTQLVMRSFDSLGTLQLNMMGSTLLGLERANKTSLAFAGALNPPVNPKEPSLVKRLLLRAKAPIVDRVMDELAAVAKKA